MKIDSKKFIKQSSDLKFANRGQASVIIRGVKTWEPYAYHQGFLFHDRSSDKSLDYIAKLLWALQELDRVVLFQQKLNPPAYEGCYYFFAPRGRKVRQTDVAEARLLVANYKDFNNDE